MRKHLRIYTENVQVLQNS